MSAPRALATGASFGAYDVVKELGRGGMGAVYRARERASGREVALKVMLDTSDATAADRERFRREGQVAASLDHPGIVRVHTAGEVGGLMFLACELVEGARDLATAARDLPPLERARLVRDAARALGHAHARGVVHRDVKPDNLLVDSSGRVRVADFGVAAARSLERLTQSGAIVGTPRYMAPEQIDADRARLGPHTDVWALGVVLHEVLAGVRPFDASAMPALYNLILNRPPPDLRVVARDAPPALADVCARALAKRPEDRYAHAGLLADELDRVLAGEDTHAGAARRARRRRAGLVAGALLMGGGAVTGWALRRGAPPSGEVKPVAGAAVVTTGEAPALEVVGLDADGWVLLASEAEGVEVRGQLEGGHVVVRVDGADVAAGEALPLRVPLPVQRGEWCRLEVDLRGGSAPLRVEAHVLRLPEHLELAGPRAARTRDGLELLLVPPPRTGSFLRRRLRKGSGSLANGYNSPSDDLNDQAIWTALSHPFLLGRTEVSAGEYAPSSDGYPRLPAVGVSREEAAAFAERRGLALPTLTEWLWAAGGGEEGRDWPWGPATTGRPANFRGPGPCPVDALPWGAGRWGQLHLAGNVFEWVAPEAASDGALARSLCMGGSWRKHWPDAATDLRGEIRPDTQHDDVGFRVAWRPAAR